MQTLTLLNRILQEEAPTQTCKKKDERRVVLYRTPNIGSCKTPSSRPESAAVAGVNKGKGKTKKQNANLQVKPSPSSIINSAQNCDPNASRRCRYHSYCHTSPHPASAQAVDLPSSLVDLKLSPSSSGSGSDSVGKHWSRSYRGST
jgi:hypothetical protein